MSGDPCVFLDRDGVINHRRLTLVRKPGQLRIVAGAPEAIARLNEAGYRVVVVTNQHPVGHGVIKQANLDAIHATIARIVEAAGGRIDAFKACTHRFTEPCTCGKPEPGMLEQAAEQLDLDREACWLVGDKASDIEAGRRFGARTIWITGSRFPWDRLRRRPSADHVAADLPAAVDVILEHP